MQNKDKKADSFTDIPTHSWIEGWFPRHWLPYVRSLRLDRPIGIYLLLIPSLWAIAATAESFQEMFFLSIIFAMGSVVMRGAGCVYNDVLDRDIDQKVARTQSRPLASGQMSVQQALWFITGLLFYSLFLLLMLKPLAIIFGFLALVPVAIYPLLKRYTYWPQVMLAIAFNWGVFMAWAASGSDFRVSTFLLYGAGLCWTMIYDTIYAHQDKEDDVLIGVKSTALKFGKNTAFILFGFSVLFCIFLYGVGYLEGYSASFFFIVWLAFGACAYQVMSLNYDDANQCLRGFKQQAYVGLAIFFAIFISRYI